MELLSKVKNILISHPFEPIYCGEYKNVYQLIAANPELKSSFINPNINDGTLIQKYKNYIPRGWYGFSIGRPVIPIWMEIIDEILELCEETDSNFEIHQVKMKFGGIDFYISSDVITDLGSIFGLISSTLRDKALVY